ncbi:MAG TPA: lysine biosynthesis protein LysX [Candidatus Dormibacteraeota bacterium]|nr:lysine biosynthesis protein LysX [Candidatus Dormibacteraeota bacterium]
MREVRVGLVYSRIRVEEKLIVAELARHRSVRVVTVADDLIQASLAGPQLDSAEITALRGCQVVLGRSLSHVRQLTVARLLEAWRVPSINSATVLEVCGDKMRTTLALAGANVPTPPTRVAFTVAAGLAAVEDLGYPWVVKPNTGSWGRLLARVNDRDAAEAVLEHKALLGGSLHRVLYLQQYVDKPGRDIRAFVIGGSTVAAIGRRSEHWVTNTARGAVAEAVPVSAELDQLCRRAAVAVGGGNLAIDLLEAPDGLLVNEVNATMEFRNSVAPTGIDIPGLLVADALRWAAS